MPRILVADDNTNIQRMVSLAFSPRGIEVVAVGNGEAAVRRLPEMNPDLVLADIFMPVRNGYEVCEYVKKDERFAHIPVILLVGAFDPLDEKEARRVGADGVLKKPFVPPDPLIAMVIAILEKNPRIAAELAKPKETAVATPAMPAIEHELPLKITPKPLPNYPEPSPAEAAMAYGFGTGRRTLDDDGPSVALKDPLAARADEDTEDGSAASNDWRQSARDFEVPEEAANMPAFASDENFRSSAPAQPASTDSAVKLPEPEPTSPVLAEIPVMAETMMAEPMITAPTMAVQAEEEGVSAIQEPESAEPSAEKIDAPPSSHFGSKTAHWTEMMGSLSEYKKGGWFAAATAAVEGAVKSEPAPAISEEPATAMNAGTNLETTEEIQGAAMPAVLDSTPAPATEEKVAIDFDTFKAASVWPNPALQETEPALVVPEASQPATDNLPLDSFFHADVKEYERSESAEPEISSMPSAFTMEKERIEKELEPILAASPSVSAEFGLDASTLAASAPGVASTNFRDPNLVVPPAVHVTPEPLLVDDEPAGIPSAYGLKSQEIAPVHSFEMPPQAETYPVEASGVGEAPNSEEKEGDLGFELRQTEIKAWGAIPKPTGRELLAHIPYLSPPADINETPDPVVEVTPEAAAAAPSNGTAIDPSMVDAIAQRVLESLEPKLHELLSQGLLKPLIENILHDELTKREVVHEAGFPVSGIREARFPTLAKHSHPFDCLRGDRLY